MKRGLQGHEMDRLIDERGDTPLVRGVSMHRE